MTSSLDTALDLLTRIFGNGVAALLNDIRLYAMATFAAIMAIASILRGRIGLVTWTVVIALGLCGEILSVVAGAAIERHVGSGRLETLVAMRNRPGDPWPRGNAHIPFGRVGIAEREKAYIEPGGSFSPAVGSFGISFWIRNDGGALIATSDDIPLEDTEARYDLTTTGMPIIRIKTPYYAADWTARDEGGYDLALAPHGTDRIEIVFRGVGPAAGPLKQISVGADSVTLNGGWRLEGLGSKQLRFLGEESTRGWLNDRSSTVSELKSKTGWAVVRFLLGDGKVELTLRQIAEPETPRSSTVQSSLQRAVTLDGVATDFATSLDAQVITIGMGLVGNETRPGDPINYPLAWLRDGAYVTVALARAGQGELAKRLALAAAPDDFFGGFGAEADAPGLGLWMLCETATMLGNRDFDRAIWPHVMRKVALIQEMLSAKKVIRHAYKGPVVPAYAGRDDLDLVAYPARNGLIDGRMDWHRPIFFLNAVSYAGLDSAAKLATRLGEIDQSKTWAETANTLRKDWRAAFLDPVMADDVANERTAIAGLWPSSVADRAAYAAYMQQRSNDPFQTALDPNHSSPWTYFTIAEAHQWLDLDSPDKVWKVLDYFNGRQTFPGLHTLSEGSGEENSFGLWKSIRGWVHPPSVTPHYWSSAELLLLQLAMLAEVRESDRTRELVIGAGVPKEWLSRDITVKGIGTAIGRVDWHWSSTENAVTVTLPQDLPVQLGVSFPSTTRVETEIRSTAE